MQRTTIRLASRDYDGMAPLIRGDVTIPGFELAVTVDNNVPRVFGALYRGTVDVSEMSLAELIYYVSREEAEFIAIPVFPARVFRHGHLFCLRDAGITGPGDLSGRRVGFQRWVQTAGVWMRGMLINDYGVSPTATQWFVATTHHWDDDHGEAIEPRDGSIIRRFTTSSVTGADTAFRALSAGEVDAMGVTEVQAPAILADPNARRLFDDWRAEEVAYFRRTRIFPIMHVLAMRRSLVAAHPELPEALFAAYSQAKRQAQERMRSIPSWTLAWKDDALRDEQEIFGGDLWPFGLAPNQHVLDTFIGYCHQQGIAARELAARELFVPSTWDLAES